MISDKNRGETRPNIQKESIPSASERRDEAGHVGVKTPLLGSSVLTGSSSDQLRALIDRERVVVFLEQDTDNHFF